MAKGTYTIGSRVTGRILSYEPRASIMDEAFFETALFEVQDTGIVEHVSLDRRASPPKVGDVISGMVMPSLFKIVQEGLPWDEHGEQHRMLMLGDFQSVAPQTMSQPSPPPPKRLTLSELVARFASALR